MWNSAGHIFPWKPSTERCVVGVTLWDIRITQEVPLGLHAEFVSNVLFCQNIEQKKWNLVTFYLQSRLGVGTIRLCSCRIWVLLGTTRPQWLLTEFKTFLQTQCNRGRQVMIRFSGCAPYAPYQKTFFGQIHSYWQRGSRESILGSISTSNGQSFLFMSNCYFYLQISRSQPGQKHFCIPLRSRKERWCSAWKKWPHFFHHRFRQNDQQEEMYVQRYANFVPRQFLSHTGETRFTTTHFTGNWTHPFIFAGALQKWLSHAQTTTHNHHNPQCWHNGRCQSFFFEFILEHLWKRVSRRHTTPINPGFLTF